MSSSVSQLRLNPIYSVKDDNLRIEDYFLVKNDNYPKIDIKMKNSTRGIVFELQTNEELKPSIFNFELKNPDLLLGPKGEIAFNKKFRLNHPGLVPVSTSRLAPVEKFIQEYPVVSTLSFGTILVLSLTSILSILMISLVKLIQIFEFFSLLAFFNISTPTPINSLFKLVLNLSNYEFFKNPIAELIPFTQKILINRVYEVLGLSPSLLESTHIDFLIFLLLNLVLFLKNIIPLKIEKLNWISYFFKTVQRLSLVLFLSYSIEYWLCILVNITELKNMMDLEAGDKISIIASIFTMILFGKTYINGFLSQKIKSYNPLEKNKLQYGNSENVPDLDFDLKKTKTESNSKITLSIKNLKTEKHIYSIIWNEFAENGLSKIALTYSILKFYNFFSLLKYKAIIIVLVCFQASGAAQLFLAFLIQLLFIVGTILSHIKYNLFKNWYFFTQTIVKETVQLILLLTLCLIFIQNFLKITSQILLEAEIILIYSAILLGVLNELLYIVLEIGFRLKKICSKKNRIVIIEGKKNLTITPNFHSTLKIDENTIHKRSNVRQNIFNRRVKKFSYNPFTPRCISKLNVIF